VWVPLQKLVEEGEETKDKEEFELGAERTVKELTSTSQVWCCKEAQGDESGERPEEAKSFVVSSPPHTALSRRRGARTRLQKWCQRVLSGTWRRRNTHRSREGAASAPWQSSEEKVRERRTGKAARGVEANPKKSWDHAANLAGWQGEKACQAPAEVRGVDGSALVGGREKREALVRHRKQLASGVAGRSRDAP